MREMGDLIFLWFPEKFWGFLRIFKANADSKQPMRSYLTSDLKYVFHMIYPTTMFILSFIHAIYFQECTWGCRHEAIPPLFACGKLANLFVPSTLRKKGRPWRQLIQQDSRFIVERKEKCKTVITSRLRSTARFAPISCGEMETRGKFSKWPDYVSSLPCPNCACLCSSIDSTLDL